MKKGIKRLRDDPELRERLGRNALSAAIKGYNWESQERVLLEIYSDISKEIQRSG